jgi:hypothetical protein
MMLDGYLLMIYTRPQLKRERKTHGQNPCYQPPALLKSTTNNCLPIRAISIPEEKFDEHMSSTYINKRHQTQARQSTACLLPKSLLPLSNLIHANRPPCAHRTKLYLSFYAFFLNEQD